MSAFSRLRRRPKADVGDVTSIDSARETAPALLGLDPRAVDRVWFALEDLWRTGAHPGISLCVRRQGQIVLNRSVGHASGGGPHDPPNGPKVVMQHDTPMCIFSAAKAVTAMLIHLLDDRGVLHIGDRVCDYVPEFAKHGKDWITLRHVMTHRSGVPSIVGPTEPDALLDVLADWDLVVQLICDARPTAPAGRRLAYHAVTGGFVLGEVVRRVTGKDVRQLLREEVTGPLGFSLLDYGIAPERAHEVAQSAFTGPTPPFPISRIAHRAFGMSFREASSLANDPRFLTALVPSGNIVTTAEQLSLFFELLLNLGELDGKRIFEERTIRRARNETAYLELDLTIGLPIRYGTGLMLGSRWISPFGPDCEQAFGHLGLTNTTAWADPERQLSVALITTGKPLVSRHLWPLWRALTGIARAFPKIAAPK